MMKQLHCARNGRNSRNAATMVERWGDVGRGVCEGGAQAP